MVLSVKLFEDTSLYVSVRVINGRGTISIGDTDKMPLIGVSLLETVRYTGNSFAELGKALRDAIQIYTFANEMSAAIDEVVEAYQAVSR